MKISGNDELSKYINEAALNRSNELADKARTHEAEPSDTPRDTVVHLSSRAKEIQLAREAMASEPEVRTEKTNEISDKIRQGTYQVDHEKTAEKMIATFFDKII